MEFSQFTGLSPDELMKAVYTDRVIDIKAKEFVVGHDWFDVEDSLTYEEKDAIHAYKAGYLAAVRHILK